MANTSFETSFQIRAKSLENLNDTDLCTRASFDIIKEVNKDRKSSGIIPLCIDENCILAAEDSFQNIANLQSLATTNNVIGSDFHIIFLDRTINLSPSMSPNQALYDGFFQLFTQMDMNQKKSIMDPNFTHAGIKVKRNFGSLKLAMILFRKQIVLFHVSLDVNTGIKVQGRVLDPCTSIFVVIVKDGKESVRPAIAGPKRITLKSDFKDFEVVIPRLLLTQRSVSEKMLEFYTVKADPRSIGYNNGVDLTSLPPEAILSHKMTFNGLWESSLKMEERSIQDSQFIRDEYESKIAGKVIVHSTNDFRSRTKGKTGNVPNTGRSEWSHKETPWKNSVNSRLSTIQEVPSEIENKSLWTRDINNKENNPFARDGLSNNTQGKEINMGFASNSRIGSENNFGKIQNSPHHFSNNSYQYQNNPAPQGFSSSSPFSMHTNMPSNPFQSMNNNVVSNPFQNSFPTNSSNFAGNNTFANPFSNSNMQTLPYSSQPVCNPIQNYSVPYSMQNNSFFVSQPSMSGVVPSNNFGVPYQNPQNPFMSTTPVNSFPSNFQMPPSSSNVLAHPGPMSQGFFVNPTQGQITNSNPMHFFSDLNRNFNTIVSNPDPNLHLQLMNEHQNLPNLRPNSFYPLVNEKTFGKSASGTFGVNKLKVESTFSQTITEKKDEIDIPCLILPIPKALLAEIRRPRPENSSYTKLFSTMEYHDVILRIKETEFKCHKAVLFAASVFFREQLEKSKTFTSVHMSKIILPTWFSLDAFKIVLKFMYSCDLDKEVIPLKLAKEMLSITDHLQIQDLTDIIIVKYILTQITRDEVISVLLQANSKPREVSESWDYLVESCALFAGQHSNWLIRNQRAECMSLPISWILKFVDYSMRFISSNEHLCLLISLITDLRYAECVFDLTNKVTELFLSGYHLTYPVDLRTLDYTRPLTDQQITKLDPSTIMEYPLLEETAPFFLTKSRENAAPPSKFAESINTTYQSGKTTSIVAQKDLVARSKLVHSFKVSDVARPKNVMSACFKSATRTWSVLLSTSKEGFLSVFLCERGPAENENKFVELGFTSVLFEIEIEDSGVTESLRNSNQPGFCAGFYCFPNNHHHMVGERHFCKASCIKVPESVKVNVYIKEIGIHSGVLHYICENFETLMNKSPKKFTELSVFNLKYLLSSDSLPICDEHQAAAALWKYAANKNAEIVNLLVCEIRFQYLSTKDIWTLARDHCGIRNTENFRYLFRTEYFRRTKNKKVTEKPRKKIDVKAETEDYNEEIIDWVLNSQHHQGFEEKVVELKKKLEEQKAENNKRNAELNAKKYEMTLEYEKLNKELRLLKGFDPCPEVKLQDTDLYSQSDKNCEIF